MKTAQEWSITLIQEHERAIKQRDAYLLTGISTASHGGSHDTCFEHIVKAIQLDAYKQACSDCAGLLRSSPPYLSIGENISAILTLRDNKTTI